MRARDPLRHHRAHSHLHGAFGGDRFGALCEATARALGTGRYLAIQTIGVVLWIAVNIVAVSLRWDPYPFILLNLAFSTQAAYAAPLILVAENRQAERDHAREYADVRHREDLHGQLVELIEQNTALTQEVRALAVQAATPKDP